MVQFAAGNEVVQTAVVVHITCVGSWSTESALHPYPHPSPQAAIQLAGWTTTHHAAGGTATATPALPGPSRARSCARPPAGVRHHGVHCVVLVQGLPLDLAEPSDPFSGEGWTTGGGGVEVTVVGHRSFTIIAAIAARGG